MKNILIFSKLIDEETTSVMSWMDFLETVNIFRVNLINRDSKITIDLNEGYIKFMDKISIKQFDKIWVRKSGTTEQFYSLGEMNNNRLNSQLSDEKNAIINHIISNYSPEKILGKTKFNDNEKLTNLIKAKEFGIDIPKTIVTSEKKELQKFYSENNCKVISKAISNSIFLNDKNKNYATYTDEITLEIIDSLQDSFFPSLFQQNINKRYEIRTFFLDGIFFSTAIFYQNHNDSKNDFRKNSTSLRYMPIKISENLSEKLRMLMQNLNINIGAIDLLVDKSGTTYFLEVNPFGQFKNFSEACNFNIEREIAKKILQV